ncbi:MAG: ATP-binding cassette domain-containing protein, partial [Candidatus Microbacterium stercoravium]
MTSVLEMNDVVVRRGARNIVDNISWTVNDDERWVVLGPNGAGKTTLLQIADTMMFPTTGTVDVLGERLGKT